MEDRITQSPVQDTVQQNKSNLIIIVFSILGIIFLISTIILYLQNQKLQKQIINQQVTSAIQNPSLTPNTESTTTVPTDEMEGWKMYVNEEYGFSFRYPKEWILEGKIFSSNQDSESLSLMINVPFGLECLRSIKEESIIFDKVNATKTLMDGVVSDLCDNANSRLVD